MTHSMTIALPEAVYQSLTEEAKQKGKRVEDIAVELLKLMASDRKINDEEFERLADTLADCFEKSMPPDAKPLSDYAMSSEEMYEDHL